MWLATLLVAGYVYFLKLQNTVYDSCNYYQNTNRSHDANGHMIEPMPYLDPVKIISGDYEVPPKLDNYEHPPPRGLFDDVKYEVADSPLPTSYTTQTDTLPVGEALPEDEQIYEDPGHIKEKIYELFKQINIRKLVKNSVR